MRSERKDMRVFMKYPVLYGHQIQEWADRNVKHVVDVGAHYGGSALTLWYIFNPKIVFAYEPISYEIMKTYTVGIKEIWPMPYAVSDEAGFVTLGMRNGINALYSIRLSEEAKTIWATTLDDKDHPCDYLKIDVEGMELNVLRGAVKTIKKRKPLIQVEMKFGRDEIHNFLTDMGYQLEMEIEKDGFYRC